MIELKLKNFKCFENKTFTFEDEMILISAPSGSGKTTILSAIKFALWGSKEGNEIMHGKSSCTVTLVYNTTSDKYTIQRSKRPNRLLLILNDDTSHGKEDQEAQAYIDTYFGSQSQNTFTGAVSNMGNFIDSSPSEKLEYLEKIALGDTETIELLKINVKEKIKTVNDEIKNTDGQLLVTKKILNSLLSKTPIIDLVKPIYNQPEVPTVHDTTVYVLGEPVYDIEGTGIYEDETIERCQREWSVEVERLRNRIFEYEILRSGLETLNEQRTEKLKKINDCEEDINVTEKNIMNIFPDGIEMVDLQIPHLQEIEKVIATACDDRVLLEDTRTKILISQANLEMLVEEEVKLNHILQDIQDIQDTEQPTTTEMLDEQSLVDLIGECKKNIKDARDFILKESISKSKIDTLLNDIKRTEESGQYEGLEEMNDEGLSKLYNDLEDLNKVIAEKSLIETTMERMASEKNVLDQYIESHTVTHNDNENKMVDKAKGLLMAITENLNQLKFHVTLDYTVSTLEKALSIIKCTLNMDDIVNNKKKYEEEVYGDLRCPKCCKYLSLSKMDTGRYKLIPKNESADSAMAYETVSKIVELISIVNDHDICLYEKNINQAHQYETTCTKANILGQKIFDQKERLNVLGNPSESHSIVTKDIHDIQTRIAAHKAAMNFEFKRRENLMAYEKELEIEKDILKLLVNPVTPDTYEGELSTLEERLKLKRQFDSRMAQYEDAKLKMATTMKRKDIVNEKIIAIQMSSKELLRVELALGDLSIKLDKLAIDLSNRQQFDRYTEQAALQRNLLKSYTDALEHIHGEIEKIFSDLKDEEKHRHELEGSIKYLEYVNKVMKEKKIFDLQMNQYSQYLERKKQYTSSVEEHTKSILHLEDTIARLTEEYKSAIILKAKISEAQSLALASLVDTINVTVQPFLDLFFDEPMVINLSMFKEASKNPPKPKVTINLYYKGVMCPHDLSSLSSGEYARVSLAFTLAFHQINGNKFTPLMLDERTANLDQDLSTLIYSVVKDTFASQLIMVVAHQVITGPFDNVMTL
jgi:DNA repair exonuclease SbcCD ATPase subunit